MIAAEVWNVARGCSRLRGRVGNCAPPLAVEALGPNRKVPALSARPQEVACPTAHVPYLFLYFVHLVILCKILQTKRANMHLRTARPSDEPELALICTRAFFDEDLFGRVIHPHRLEYPEDVQIFWHERVREDWSNPCNKVIVAVTNDKEQGEKILGMAVWQRQGDDVGAQQVKSEWTDHGEWPALLSTHNRALDPSNKTILEEAAPFTKHYWSGPNTTNWYLSLCCVHPDAKGRGVGRLLVRWGLDRAEKEGVAASVVASDGSDAFYLKCGFDEVVGTASEGNGNPLQNKDVKGGKILFMWSNTAKGIETAAP